MSDRSREQWTQAHRQRVVAVEKVLAGLMVLLGIGMVWSGEGFAQFAGSAVAGAGVWVFFPSIRPMISGVVRRLPFLRDEPVVVDISHDN